MADLLTTDTLAIWTDNDPVDVGTDDKAATIISTVSQMACFLGGHDGATAARSPEWTLTPGVTMAPFDVQIVVLQVCKRSYENSRQVISEGNVGPIGGDTVAAAAALLLDLTDAERATLTKYNPDGDPNPVDGSGQVFTIATTRGTDDILVPVTLYVGDDQQVALADSEDPREWKIPLFNPNDPGDPNNYPDEE